MQPNVTVCNVNLLKTKLNPAIQAFTVTLAAFPHLEMSYMKAGSILGTFDMQIRVLFYQPRRLNTTV